MIEFFPLITVSGYMLYVILSELLDEVSDA
jgi:hypothetical protein